MASDTVGNGHTAIRKCILFDAGNTVWNSHAGQSAANPKHIHSNASYAIVDNYGMYLIDVVLPRMRDINIKIIRGSESVHTPYTLNGQSAITV